MSYEWIKDRILIERFKIPLQRSIKKLSDIDVAMFISDERIIENLPNVFWIPDFQHKKLSDFFSKEEIYERDTNFLNSVKRATLIITSSENAKKDFKEFYPNYLSKVRVLKFTPFFDKQTYLNNSTYISAKYEIPKKFIYIPNQFWKHKNHLIVFQALAILKKKNINPFIVFTGNTIDYRHPEYFENLTNQIKDWNISQNYKILGLVPSIDRVSL
jgi:glycosyltransferase involved in cell wall biosynthesis